MLKIKLAMAIIGISSIHLLRTQARSNERSGRINLEFTGHYPFSDSRMFA